jgi:GAF domain-containing protein
MGVKSVLDRYLKVRADDELVAQRGQRLLLLMLVVGVADLLTILNDVISGIATPGVLTIELLAFVIFGVLYWYTRRGHRWPPYVFLAFMAVSTPYVVQDALTGPDVLAAAIPVVVAPLIAAPWGSIPVAAVEVGILYVLGLASYPNYPVVTVILGVLGVVSWLSSSSLENAFKEAHRNSNALAESNRELQTGRALLEARTYDLERRSVQLTASAEVSRAVISILETDQLIRQVVELIRERFDLYYVGLFLVDAAREWAVLRAGTGEAGQAMLGRGHRIKIGEGMVGWSIARAQARVALEAGRDAVRLATAELPDTRSEAALPLRSRGQVIGALTVQSIESGAFDQDTITALQTMADQVAVALDNARLFTESQAALEAERRIYGEAGRQAWAELLRTRTDWGYRYAQKSIAPAKGDWRAVMRQAARTGQTVQGSPRRARSLRRGRSPEPAAGGDGAGEPTLAIPLKLRGQVVGVLGFRRGESDERWTTEAVTLLETLAEQLSVALESARLYQDTQRRAEYERLSGEATARMRETMDVDAVLQTAVHEMRQILDLAEVEVRMGIGFAPGEAAADVEPVDRSANGHG